MYFGSNLFYYKLVFLAELLAAEFVFLARFSKRQRFVLRLILTLALDFAFAALVPIVEYNILYSSVVFVSIFFFTVFTMKICFNVKWSVLIFCCISGYCIQHIAYELYSLVCVLLDSNQFYFIYGQVGNGFISFLNLLYPNVFLVLIYAAIYFCVYFVAAWLFGNRIGEDADVELGRMSILALVFLIVIIDIFMNDFVLYTIGSFTETAQKKMMWAVLNVYNILCCGMALFIEFQLVIRKKITNELATINRLRYEENEHYKSSRENVDLINMKCHDLKHAISAYGKQNMISEDYIKEMEGLISIYESDFETGNSVLDLIFAEKSLYCRKNNIRLSCIIDGKSLSFMSESCIYSLFGNLLENAIEAVERLGEDKRQIGVHVSETDGVVHINIYNCFESEIMMIDDLPRTTKEDNGYHGYGLKSIRHIVESYGGTLSVLPHDNIFEVDIFIPVPKT